MIGIIAAAGVMAAISAYLLFKVKESNLGVGLQVLFFFMILASFIVMGSAGYESRNDCAYLLTNSSFNGTFTENSYEWTCTERSPAAGSWVYRLPVWFAYICAGYIIIYFLILIKKLYDGIKGKGGDRDFEK